MLRGHRSKRWSCVEQKPVLPASRVVVSVLPPPHLVPEADAVPPSPRALACMQVERMKRAEGWTITVKELGESENPLASA